MFSQRILIQHLLLIMSQGEIQALTLKLDVINNNAIISNIVQVVQYGSFCSYPILCVLALLSCIWDSTDVSQPTDLFDCGHPWMSFCGALNNFFLLLRMMASVYILLSYKLISCNWRTKKKSGKHTQQQQQQKKRPHPTADKGRQDQQRKSECDEMRPARDKGTRKEGCCRPCLQLDLDSPNQLHARRHE